MWTFTIIKNFKSIFITSTKDQTLKSYKRKRRIEPSRSSFEVCEWESSRSTEEDGTWRDGQLQWAMAMAALDWAGAAPTSDDHGGGESNGGCSGRGSSNGSPRGMATAFSILHEQKQREAGPTPRWRFARFMYDRIHDSLICR